MLKKTIITIFMLITIILGFNYVQASSYAWDIGGLKQMDYDSIQGEELEVELTFYCAINDKVEGGALAANGKPVVYGNLANNYFTGIKSIAGGRSWEKWDTGYSLGTNVYIKDVGLFTIEDRGGDPDFNTKNRMDLFVPRNAGESDADYLKRTNAYGRQKVKLKIIKDGTARNWEWPSGNSTSSLNTSSITQVGSGKLNFKVTYNNSRTVTTSGTKPVALTANCKDAEDAYWGKTTTVMENSSESLNLGAGDNNFEVKIPANIDASQWIYPLVKRHTADPKTGARYFGAPRDSGARAHAGIDLIVPPGTAVIAMTDGTVIQKYNFYQNTDAVEVKNDDGTVVRYTEMYVSVSAGQKIKKGDVLGKIVANYSGSAMLHVEVYDGSGSGALTIANSSNYKNVPARNYKRRSDIMDPSFVAELPMATVQ